MRFTTREFVLAAVGLLLFVPALWAQEPTDADYAAERSRAIGLFNENKQLEALPLFEDLAKRKPGDDLVLVELAACLARHSFTLEGDAATKERLRARDLLLQAKAHGFRSAMMDNMLQTIPADGKVEFDKTAIGQAMHDAETAFANQNFPEAIRNYQRVLALDPANYIATAYIGDSYYAARDFDHAGEWYNRAIDLDPNQALAYRYYSDTLIQKGDMQKARTLAIQAVVAEPYNPMTWRSLQYWAQANHVELKAVRINTPQPPSTKDGKINITMNPSDPPDVGAVWLAYSMDRALWQRDKFKQQFPHEAAYRHSLAEESDSLRMAAKVCQEMAQKNDNNKNASALPTDPGLALLLRLYQADMIEPYVLLNAADAGIAQDYAAYREKNRAKLEQYLSTFIVPPTPATPK